MEGFDIETYLSRSRALDLSGISWEDVPRHPLSPDAVRALRYMQDIETHTIVYLRTLLGTRAIDDPEVAAFFACWFYEETFHGRALAQFLAAAGHSTVARTRSRTSVSQRLDALVTQLVARTWPDFVAVHMTWGAINELTTLTGYHRLSQVAGHPVLSELLARIMRDESRHFSFYFRQAEERLARPRVSHVVRTLIDHYWAPVGSGVQLPEETRFLARYLFDGAEGRAAGRRIDETIRGLPGFADVRLVDAWVEKALRVAARPACDVAQPGTAAARVLGARSPLLSLLAAATGW